MKLRSFISTATTVATVISVVAITLCYISQLWGKEEIYIIKLLLLLSTVAILIPLFIEIKLQWHWIDTTILLGFIYATINYYFYSSAPSGLKYYHLLTSFMLYVVLRLLQLQCKYVLIVSVACAGLYEIVLGIMQLFGFAYSNNVRCVTTGTFYNSGPYSGYVLVALSIATAYIYHRYKLYTFPYFRKWRGIGFFESQTIYSICLITFMGGLIILPATWSRASIIGYVIILVVLLYNRYKRWILYIVLFSFILGFFLYFAKQGSANGRLLIWYISLLAIIKSPITGHGIGDFASTFGNTQANFFQSNPESAFVNVAGSPDYAFNELLNIGVEQGVIGMFFLVIISIGSYIILFKNKNELAYGWLALLVFSLFSYPFALLPFRVLAVLFVATAAGYHKKDRGNKSYTIVRIAIGVVLVLLASLLLPHIKNKVKENKEYAQIGCINDIAFINDYEKWNTILSDNPHYLFNYGKLLNQAERYNESNAVLRMGTLVSTDPMFYVIMGNNYKKLRAYKEAEEYYEKAFNRVPSRMYPLYQLLHLYIENADSKKAIIMAQRLVNFKPKIRSKTTDEMKKFAIDFLNNHRKTGLL